ncbi:hypothetical protein BHYA_0033g00410 [Botrytis hyacinthi]|uniref:Uncharacterized protein n=1 Tax=Botrytis hyacinthi TaxID=278943 RepID=A0A4Z1H6C5_9HELO|nr:hypothetical protein BHYA_0033g00410 [Botrytis hyacinthi]
MARSDDNKLLIAVFMQWRSARIDTNKLGEDLGINCGAAGMRLFRLKARLRTGEETKNADDALLTAIINQEKRLPRLDYKLLGADLEINPGAAAMLQQQERETNHPRSDPAENSIASEKETRSTEPGVFGWPYNEKGWPDEA